MSMESFFAALGGLPPGWKFMIWEDAIRTASPGRLTDCLCPLQAVYYYETSERVTALSLVPFAVHFGLTMAETLSIVYAADGCDQADQALRDRLLTACKLDGNS